MAYYHERPGPSFFALFLGKVVLLLITIVVVWMIYAYLHAFRLAWLGWITPVGQIFRHSPQRIHW